MRPLFLQNPLTNFLSYAIITTRYNCTLNKTEAFMNKWSPERAEAIRQFIDEYFMENRKSPTVRDIAAGTGISKTSVQRYLTDMKEHGEIEYNGRRSIGTNLSRNMFETTPAIRYDSTVSCGLPSEPNVEEAEIIPLPTALVGEGKFFILTAKGDSMTGIGVDDGDLVIVREQNTCRDGDYAVVLVNGNETLLKTITYLPDKKAYLLHAENPDYDDRIERNVQIQGVATQVIKKL